MPARLDLSHRRAVAVLVAEVALPNSFAVGFILQADREIKKLFNASHLNLYIESIQQGYQKFLAKQNELASNLSMQWKSPIHNV